MVIADKTLHNSLITIHACIIYIFCVFRKISNMKIKKCFVIIIWVSLCWLSQLVDSSDVRCKCICPKEAHANKTNVIIVNSTSPETCTCAHVVKREETFCLKCECKYETRNTLLIKVIVIFVIISITSLYVYMLFLFIRSKQRKIPLSVTSDIVQEELKQPAFIAKKRRTLSITSIEQKMTAWQQKVDIQRNHVYGDQAVLS